MDTVNPLHLREIASKFSPSAVKRLIHEGISSPNANVDQVIKGQHVGSVADWYQSAYKKLLSGFRNEYVYKNAIAEKVIRGRHKFSANCFFTSEFRVRGSIADVVIANGTTTAYEIKTEYDSFERLSGQLEDYAKVFEHVYVVIPEVKLIDWETKVPNEVGIIVLTENYTLRQCREPSTNISKFDLVSMFSCFRRHEFVAAIQNQFGFVPGCRPVELKTKCRNLFLSLDKEQAHSEFVKALKSRRVRDEQIELLKEAPPALTSALLSLDMSLKEVMLLNRKLQEVI